MVKASGQIEKELGLLQQRTEDMDKALDPMYNGYLKALGEASKQQLMSAVYHLCTQAYPDKFLSLSWQQRNQLQTSLQTLAAQIQVQLIEQREQVKRASRKPPKNNGLAFLQRLLEARSSGAVIHTQSGSSDDLLDKLSEIARFEKAAKASGANVDKDTELADSVPLPESALDHEESDGTVADDDPLWDREVPSAEPTDFLTEDDPDSHDHNENSFEENSFETAAIEEIAEDLARDSESSSGSSRERAFEEDELDFEMVVPAAEQRLTISEEEDLLGALEALARRSADDDETADETEQPLAPVHLIKQQMLMEKAIRDVFKAVSTSANELLQKAGVMPNFPKALMAAAADSQGMGEPINAVPNVVKVSVRVMHGEANFEADDERALDNHGDQPGDRRRMRRMKSKSRDRQEKESREKNRPGMSKDRRREAKGRRRFMPQEAIEIDAFPEFAVINLQLNEVEFADPRVSVWRGRLRKELSHLKQLGARYKKTQRSLETAQAEDAWRSSWTAMEDD